MTVNEFDKLKAGDTIYYVVENGNDFITGESKVKEKKVVDGHRMLSFYPDEKVESETTLFSYAYDWGGLVVRFYYENVFLTKEEAEEIVERFNKKEPYDKPEDLPF